MKQYTKLLTFSTIISLLAIISPTLGQTYHSFDTSKSLYVENYDDDGSSVTSFDISRLFVTQASGQLLFNTYIDSTANIGKVAISALESNDYLLGFSHEDTANSVPDFYFKNYYSGLTGENNYLALGNAWEGDLMYFTGDNKIGIGTASPDETLHVDHGDDTDDGGFAAEGIIGAYFWDDDYPFMFDIDTNGGEYIRIMAVSPNVTGTGDWHDYFFSWCADEFSVSGCDDDWEGATAWRDQSTIKTFIIDHPEDSDRYLIHTGLEGPEAGVFYHGSVQLSEGKAKITLPDYVIPLIKPNSETILLQNITGFDDLRLNTTHLKDGYFEIISETSNSTALVSWEFKGERKNAEVPIEPRKDTVVVKGQGPYKYIVQEDSQP